MRELSGDVERAPSPIIPRRVFAAITVLAALVIISLREIEDTALTATVWWSLLITTWGGLVAIGLVYVQRARAFNVRQKAHQKEPTEQKQPNATVHPSTVGSYIAIAVILVIVGLAIFIFGAVESGDPSSPIAPWIYYGLGLCLVVVGLAVQSSSPVGPDLFEQLVTRALGIRLSEVLIIAGFALTISSTILLFDPDPNQSNRLSAAWATGAAVGALLTMFGVMRGDDFDAPNEQEKSSPAVSVVRARNAVRAAKAALKAAEQAADAAAEASAAAATNEGTAAADELLAAARSSAQEAERAATEAQTAAFRAETEARLTSRRAVDSAVPDKEGKRAAHYATSDAMRASVLAQLWSEQAERHAEYAKEEADKAQTATTPPNGGTGPPGSDSTAVIDLTQEPEDASD